ncbi:tetratricopeptide repeat protein [candidate division WOR-3 bacterium]|nr:tetratricopeptide repeat protein [candidate division WOR-3 bacterium]
MAHEFSEKIVELLKQGKREEAELLIKQATELIPKTAENYLRRGIGYLYTGNKEMALSDFRKAVELDPDNIEARSRLGGMLMMLNKHEMALETYEEILRREPTNQMAWHSKLNALFALNREQEALDLTDELVDRFPDRTDFWRYSKSGMLAQLKRYKEALEIIESIVGPSVLTPFPAYSYYLSRAVILSCLERYDDALDMIEKGMETTKTEKGCVTCFVGNIWRVPHLDPLRKPPYRERLEAIIGPKPKVHRKPEGR